MPRREIDPQLPFIQVDRGVGPKAAMLAPLLSLTYQHVRGAMDVFWEGLADRRLLNVTALILTEKECRARLRLAFGCDVDLEALATVGFLEPVPNGYRIRGMSRYLETEAKRQKKHPPSVPEGSIRGPAGVPPVLPGSTSGTEKPSLVEQKAVSVLRGPAEVRGERLEVRDERSETATATPANLPVASTSPDRRNVPVTVERPTSPPDTWLVDDFWAWAQSIRAKSKLLVEVHKPKNMGAWYSTALMTPGVTVPVLQRAFYAFGRSKHWEHTDPPYPFRGFVSQWDQFASAEVANASGA